MWIKICANTNLEDAKLAVELGADALGFVFAPSPRQVDAAHVATITPYLPRRVERIGVFQELDFAAIADAVKQADLSGVQLHGGHSPELITKLRKQFGDALRIIQTTHVLVSEAAPQQLAEQLSVFARDPEIDAVLADSRTATGGNSGGTGIAFDWYAARSTLNALADKPLVVAGGLNAENVAEAIAVLKPFGVDVASGVESSSDKRRKDLKKLRAFLENARSASF